MSLIWPNRLSLARLPTPVEPLQRFFNDGDVGNCRVWIKRDDQTGCVTSGNKVRKLEFTLAEALEQKASVLITCGGVQSNHCRTTALLASRLGLKCHLLLRGEPDELKNKSGNLFLNQLVGAEISCYSSVVFKRDFNKLLEQTCQFYLDKGEKPFFIPMGASDATGVWAYINACKELSESQGQLPAFTDIVCATGSGGTLAGLIAGNALFDLGARVHGINVCDNAAYFERKVMEDLNAWQQKYDPVGIDVNKLEVNIVDGYVGEGYARASGEVISMIKRMAQVEGIILDPIYTGKAFYGLVSEIQKGYFGRDARILFIHTGGVFGLFSQAEKFTR